MDSAIEAIMTQPRPLSDEQQEAVLSTARFIKVVAGAGAGKTETLTRRIVRLILDEGAEPQSIVGFTFTEKAAQGMKSRIYERVRELGGEDACNKLGEMFVGTIHGYCLQLLQEHYEYGGYTVLDENQEMAFVMREGWGLGLGGRGYSKNCQDFLKSVNVVYNELLDRQGLEAACPEFVGQLRKYEELLDGHRLLTFGRIIFLAVDRLERDPTPAAGVRYLLVDEYQDINRAQERLVTAIGRTAEVFAVGDPRQSIYQWRGSDERCFEDFDGRFPGAETLAIRENRRSAKTVVRVANAFADTFERVRYEPLKHVRPEEGLAAIVGHETPEAEAEWVVGQIARYVERGRCSYGDCAILLRSVSTSAGPFLEALRSRGIPYIVGGKAGLFRRGEARAVGRLFAWLWEEGFWVKDRWSWSERIAGDDLLHTAIDSWKEATGIDASESTGRLREWKEKTLAGGFRNLTEVYQELLVILGFLGLDPEKPLDAAVMANLGRFSSLLADYESSRRLGGRTVRWKSAVKGLCWFMTSYATGAYEEQPGDDIRGLDAVQVMTIHQSKGLEWPVVFLPALVDQRFPSSMTGSKRRWFIPRDSFDVERYEGEVEDERRLFYVALTRAKDVLCLSYFRRIRNRTRPSEFLEAVRSLATPISPARDLPDVEVSVGPDQDALETYSAAEILTYMKCPFLYRLRELWQYKPALEEALGYGKSLHYCLKCASELMAEGAAPDSAVQRAVDENFHVPYAGRAIRRTMKERACEVLTRFVRDHREDILKAEEMESRIEFQMQQATVTGVVDVIMKDGESVEVRDYKTSDEVTTFELASLQVRLYSLGLQMAGFPVNRASIAYLEEVVLREVGVQPHELRRAQEEVEGAIAGIRAGSFRPTRGFCDHCDQVRRCPSGHRGG